MSKTLPILLLIILCGCDEPDYKTYDSKYPNEIINCQDKSDTSAGAPNVHGVNNNYTLCKVHNLSVEIEKLKKLLKAQNGGK